MSTLISEELPRLRDLLLQAQGVPPFGILLSQKTIGSWTREVNVQRAIDGEELLDDIITWHTQHGNITIFHDDLLKENTFRWVLVDKIGRVEILPIAKIGMDNESRGPKITILNP